MEDTNYVTLLLINGDELVAELDYESDQDYVLEMPAITVIVDNKILIRRYSRLTNSTSFVISKKHVIFCNSLSKEFIVKYQEFKTLNSDDIQPENKDNIISFNTVKKIIN